jgi:hypothetical protein
METNDTKKTKALSERVRDTLKLQTVQWFMGEPKHGKVQKQQGGGTMGKFY